MIKAKKSLGQNFLVDRNILEKIVNVTQITDKTVLEVGPGTGNLTYFILKKKPKKIIVVEKDEDLANHLEETFKNELTIINDDILKINESSLFESKVTVFGNLPYNISTEILSKWITNSTKDFFKIKNPKNLEKVTRIFFNHRRKMIKKPFNQLFNGNQKVSDELKINLNLRPQNLDFNTYYKLTEAYEKLRS